MVSKKSICCACTVRSPRNEAEEAHTAGACCCCCCCCCCCSCWRCCTFWRMYIFCASSSLSAADCPPAVLPGTAASCAEANLHSGPVFACPGIQAVATSMGQILRETHPVVHMWLGKGSIRMLAGTVFEVAPHTAVGHIVGHRVGCSTLSWQQPAGAALWARAGQRS